MGRIEQKTDIEESHENLNRLVQKKIENVLAGKDHPNIRQAEAGAYRKIEQVSQKQHNLIIAQTSFSEREPDYLAILREARQHAHQIFGQVLTLFLREGFSDLETFQNISLPVVCIDLNNLPEAARFIGIEQNTLGDALMEASHWKASEHMILTSSDPDHNHPSYVRKLSSKLGLSLLDFFKKQQLHELLHLITDQLTTSTYGVYSTWYNEGVGEYFARFDERAKDDLKEKSVTLESILNDPKLKYGGGWLLANLIASTYNSEDPDHGLIQFSQELFSEKGDGLEDLNERTTATLTDNQSIEAIRAGIKNFSN